MGHVVWNCSHAFEGELEAYLVNFCVKIFRLVIIIFVMCPIKPHIFVG